MITVAVLGDVELRRDGAPVPVRPGKTSELLVRLALDAGRLVRTDQLIADLWSDEGSGAARNTLQVTASRLRRSLGEAAVLSGSPAGYTLHVEPQDVDALQAPRLAAQAGACLSSGDPGTAQRLAESGLALFRGDVLRAGGDGGWLVPPRVQLEEVRLQLLRCRIGARLDLGDASEVVPELEGLVRQYPLAEDLWALLMLGLYRCGRQADALAAFRRVRGVLADELGMDPGPALKALERRVLVQDPALDTRLRVPTQRASAPSQGNLPALPAWTLGREKDKAALSVLLGSQRLVTLVGTAGVGKTRLATDCAHDAGRVDGAWLVRLEHAGSADDIRSGVAAALGVRGTGVSGLLDHLRGSDALLVLDNCEQVVDGVATCVTELLDGAPGITILCTSQLPLSVDGEAVYQLEPLLLEDSVRLFTRLAVEQRRSFVLDAEAELVVREVCRTLDGLPLAIELAAARARVLPVQEIARRLSDRFALLNDPASSRPHRRRALGAAIGWSYDLLFPDDQRGLWELACFADSASLAAVEHVLQSLDVPAASALDVVDRLVTRSLVTVQQQPGGAVRYRLLDSVRAYALERAQEGGLADAARQAHAAWFAAAAAAAAEGTRGPSQAEHLAVAAGERVELEAALAWTAVHAPAVGLKIASGFAWAWFLLGERAQGAARLRSALSAAETVTAVEDRVRALCLLAWLENHDVQTAHADAQRAIDLAERAADEHWTSLARAALAFVLLEQAQPQEALRLLQDCPAVHRRSVDRWEEAAAWILTVHAALLTGDTARAAVACRAAELLLRDLGDDWALGHLDGALGFLAQAEQRYPDAADHLRSAADASGRSGFRATQALHLGTLGRIQQLSGNLEEATATLQEALAIGLALKDMRVLALTRARLARVLRAQGQHREATVAAHAADHWFSTSGGGEGAALAACLAAALEADDGSDHAAERLETVLQQARQHGDREVELLALDALARTSATHGDGKAARSLLDAADALLPSVHHLMVEADRVDARAARLLLL